MRIAVVTTHPIQNQVPWIRGLAAQPGVVLRAFFGMIPDAVQQGEGFGVPFQWDVPLREGYDSVVLPNRARHPSPARFFGIDAPGIGAALDEFSPDVVILCGWHSRFLWQAERAARRRGVPMLSRGDSNALRRRAPWKRWIHRRHLRRFEGLLATGRSNTAFLRDLGVPAARIHSAPHCIDPRPIVARVPEGDAERGAARDHFEVPRNATCSLFVGKFQPMKRPLDLLEAFLRVARADASLHLLFVGAGELEGALRGAGPDVGASVSFAGFLNQSEIGAAYGVADVLVLPSDFGETWGLVVNEAMACGLPAIVSDRVGCGPDLVRPDETGLVFPFGDVEALAACLVRLATDPTSRRNMGARARALVEVEYSIEHAVRGTLDAVEAVLRERARPDGRTPGPERP